MGNREVQKRCLHFNYATTQLPNYSIFLMRSHPKLRRTAFRSGEDGYVLLTLLLVVALMIMATAVILPSITFEIRRDREEEMIHRGVQYSRAIRAYYKKFGRYPTKLEDLENTNNLRFLRKRYKDPITGKDFRLLHYGEVKLNSGTGIGGIAPGVGGVLGANAAGVLGGLNGTGGLGQPSAFGGNSPFGQSSAFGGTGNSGFGQNTLGGSGGFGTNSNSSFGQNQPENNSTQGTDASQSSSQPPGSNQPGTQTVPGSDNPGDRSTADQPSQTFGGGPIVGVVSLSKKDTIREFNRKKKYNEWQFIYDPGTDRGGLLMTPNQPPIQGFGQTPQNPNAPNTGPGSTSSFGTPPIGIQNNPNPPGPGTGTVNQPSFPPDQ